MTFCEFQIARTEMLAVYQDRLDALVAERERELHALQELFRHGERRQKMGAVASHVRHRYGIMEGRK